MQTRAALQPRENKAMGTWPAEPGVWWSPCCGAGATGIKHPALGEALSPRRKASDHGVSTFLFSGFLFCSQHGAFSSFGAMTAQSWGTISSSPPPGDSIYSGLCEGSAGAGPAVWLLPWEPQARPQLRRPRERLQGPEVMSP